MDWEAKLETNQQQTWQGRKLAKLNGEHFSLSWSYVRLRVEKKGRDEKYFWGGGDYMDGEMVVVGSLIG